MRKEMAVAAAVLVALLGLGGETRGQDQFPKAKEVEIGGQKVKMVMTGQAIRKKYFFSVYAVASYVQEGAPIRSAPDLVTFDGPKALHLVMLRSVSGADMADSLLSILRQNHPAPAFADEAKQLAGLLQAGNAKEGDHIFITHIPRVGLHFKRIGGEEGLIRNVAFSGAMWESYFGRYNVGEDVKRGLLSALQK